MAAPKEITLTNLSGKYALNKSVSDPVDPTLTLQGVSWLTRKAIGFATVVLSIKQYKDDKGALHIDITSVASGLTSTQENRTCDWQVRPHEDRIFGKVEGRSRLFTEYQKFGSGLTEDDVQFLLGKKLKDGSDSKFDDTQHLQAYVKSVGNGWEGEMVWGFEEIDGKRHYTRRTVVWKGDQTERSRQVYDYQGPLAKSDDEDNLAYGESS